MPLEDRVALFGGLRCPFGRVFCLLAHRGGVAFGARTDFLAPGQQLGQGGARPRGLGQSSHGVLGECAHEGAQSFAFGQGGFGYLRAGPLIVFF